MKKLLISALCLGAMGAGCGTAGNDPVAVLGDPMITPTLLLPFSNSIASATQSLYTSGHDNFEWTFFANQTVSVGAPAEGLVVEADSSVAGASYIVIYHNARVSTRLSKLAAISVRPGDRVVAGQVIGSSTTTLQFYVVQEKSSVCPYTFITPEARLYINQRLLSGSVPCT